MKVLVPVKRVIDYTVKIRVRKDQLGVEKKTAKMSLNPFCEIAVEQAVRLKEQGIASELVALSIGPQKSVEQLRTAMAMGVDRSIHIVTDLETDTELSALSVSRILAAMVSRESPSMVLMGKQSIDGDNCATAAMLAGRLGWPQACFASEMSVDGDSAEVLREIDGGAQRVRVALPAVISADLRLNEPRFATLQNIMKAKKKPVETLKLEELGVELEQSTKYLSVSEPPKRQAGEMVGSVEELFDKLKHAQLV